MNRNIKPSVSDARQHHRLRHQEEARPSFIVDDTGSQYVLKCSDGGIRWTSFADAEAHAAHIAKVLGQSALAFAEADFGQLSGYVKYLSAIEAWRSSPMATQTYYDPGTPHEVIAAFERYRRSDAVLRVFYGDPVTGRDFCFAHSTCGRVTRTPAPMQLPLLIEDGEHGVKQARTARVVRLIDWDSERELYRHPAYHQPEMSLAPTDSAEYPWSVTFDGAARAQFAGQGRAAAYLAFMRGVSVDRKCFR